MPPDSICPLLLSTLQVCSETSTADLRAMRQPWQSHSDRDVFLSMSKQGLRQPSVGQFGEALVSCTTASMECLVHQLFAMLAHIAPSRVSLGSSSTQMYAI